MQTAQKFQGTFSTHNILSVPRNEMGGKPSAEERLGYQHARAIRIFDQSSEGAQRLLLNIMRSPNPLIDTRFMLREFKRIEDEWMSAVRELKEAKTQTMQFRSVDAMNAVAADMENMTSMLEHAIETNDMELQRPAPPPTAPPPPSFL
jgi:hypothetical protein